MSWKFFIVPAALLLLLPFIPFLAGIRVGDDTCNYLFSATGVLFSVSMSLIIAFNTREVTDPLTKARLRKSMRGIRDVLIAYFVISLLGLLLLKHIPDRVDLAIGDYGISLPCNFKLGYIMFSTWFLLVILVNYRKIHKNYEGLEDASNKNSAER